MDNEIALGILSRGSVLTVILYIFVLVKTKTIEDYSMFIPVVFFYWFIALPYLVYCGIHTFLVWPNRNYWLRDRWAGIKTTPANIRGRLTKLFSHSAK